MDRFVFGAFEPVALNTPVSTRINGANTSAGVVKLPLPYIRGAILVAGADGAGLGAATFNFSFTSITIGVQNIGGGAVGGQLVTSPQYGVQPFFVPTMWKIPLNEEVTIGCTMQLTDVGSGNGSCTLVYSDVPFWEPSGQLVGFTTYWDTRHGLTSGAKNTANSMGTLNGVTSGINVMNAPSGSGGIILAIVGGASDSAQLGVSSLQVKLTGDGLGAGYQEEDLPGPVFGGTLITGGIDGVPPVLTVTAIPVAPSGGPVTPQAFVDKTVAGNPAMAAFVSLCYQMPMRA